MLIVQHKCAQGYGSTFMALETALSTGAGTVMVHRDTAPLKITWPR